MHRKLNLGCGNKTFSDFWNVDVSARYAPDEVVNLNHLPWPWPDNSFDYVRALEVIEHLDEPLKVMEEIRRVCSHGAVVEITVPHFSSANAFTDPTHKHYFGLHTFGFFTAEGFFPDVRQGTFKVQKNYLFFHPGLFSRLYSFLANRFPKQYEQRWAWIFPGWFMGINLEVEKRAA